MDVLDLFQGNLFEIASLTDAINHGDYKPDFLDSLGLFAEEGIASRQVIIEEEYQTLRLVPNAPYGGVPATRQLDKRKGRSFIVPHLPTADSITAEEVQGVRSYATNLTPAQALLSVQQLRDKKLAQMRGDLEATLEHHRIGAIRGQILDADGSSVILDLFSEFEVSQQSHEMLLNTAATNVIVKIREAIRKSQTALGQQMVTGWVALCSDSFFDKFTGHAKVEDKYLGWQASSTLTNQHRAYGAFEFGSVTWYNYRGSVGGVDFIPNGKAFLFPTGARKLFIAKYGPSDYIDRINNIPSPDGLPIEVRADTKHMGKGIDIEAQSNPLFLCTKPRAVILLHEHTA